MRSGKRHASAPIVWQSITALACPWLAPANRTSVCESTWCSP